MTRFDKISMSVGLLCASVLTATAARADPWYIMDTDSWSQSLDNTTPTPLLDWSNNYCYLTRVSGRYAGDGESVQVYRDGSLWYVRGSSHQRDVTATAKCFTYTALKPIPSGCQLLLGNCGPGSIYIGGPFSINTGGEITGCDSFGDCTSFPPPPATENTWNGDAATILSGITGEFNGGGERVEIDQAGNPSGFNTFSARAGSFNGVGGWAETLFVGFPGTGFVPAFYGPNGQNVSANPAGVYSASTSAGHPAAVVEMAFTSEAFCYFTAIGGAFNGDGEYVQITAQPYPDGEHWVLEVGSGQSNGTSAMARCYALDQTVSRSL
jgi:hypothetical protein